MSPFCLVQVSTAVLESLGLHHGERGICADSRGSWKTHQPLETHGNQGTALRGIITTVKMTGRSRAALTTGFINSGGQIWTWEKQEVPCEDQSWIWPWFLSFGEGSTSSSAVQEWTPLFLWLPAQSCFPSCCSFTVKVFWACVPRQGDANSYLGLEEGRKSWLLNTTAHTNPHVGVPPHCDHGTTTAFQGFSMFFVCFDHYQQYYL